MDERNEVVDWLDYYRQMDREEEMHVSKSINEFKNKTSIPEMMSHLKLKSKKDKGKKEEKDKSKSGSKSSKNTSKVEDVESSSTSAKSIKKSKDGKHSTLGIFSTLRKKSSKKQSKTVVDEDKDIDESNHV